MLKRIITITCIITSIMLSSTCLTGCASFFAPLLKEEASRLIQKKLNSKYGIDTEIDDIYKDYGTYGFSEKFFRADLHLKDDPEKKFKASVSLSRKDYTDDYGSIIYNDKLTELVQEQLDKLNDYPSSFELRYDETDEQFDDPESWQEYVKYYVTLFVELNAPSGASHKQIADVVTPFLTQMHDFGFHTAYINVNQDDQRILMLETDPFDEEPKGYDYVLDNFLDNN